MSDIIVTMNDLVINGDVEGVRAAVAKALAAGTAPQDLLDQGLLPGMDVVGKRFKAGDMFIPEVLLSARTMSAAMEILRPRLSEAAQAGSGTVVIGTVEGDIHNIGKNLVAMLLEGAGFKVIDLGIDIKPAAFVQAAQQHKADIVAMSALLTTTMPKMADTVTALREAGIRGRLKIMAGGAPVTDEFVRKIGADAYASNAASAVDKAKSLLGL